MSYELQVWVGEALLAPALALAGVAETTARVFAVSIPGHNRKDTADIGEVYRNVTGSIPEGKMKPLLMEQNEAKGGKCEQHKHGVRG